MFINFSVVELAPDNCYQYKLFFKKSKNEITTGQSPLPQLLFRADSSGTT